MVYGKDSDIAMGGAMGGCSSPRMDDIEGWGEDSRELTLSFGDVD